MNDDRLLLLAHEPADFAPLSALLQDAVLAAGDAGYDRRARRFVLLVSRYRWEAAGRSRVRTALRFDAVLRVERRRWPADPATPLDLLAMTLAGETVALDFAGGVALRLVLDGVSVMLEDLSAPWPVRHVPGHDAA